MIIHKATPITYQDNYGNTVGGVVVDHDNHLRAIVVRDGAGKFDALAVVDYDAILTVGTPWGAK